MDRCPTHEPLGKEASSPAACYCTFIRDAEIWNPEHPSIGEAVGTAAVAVSC